jgi:hypothetical protein
MDKDAGRWMHSVTFFLTDGFHTKSWCLQYYVYILFRTCFEPQDSILSGTEGVVHLRSKTSLISVNLSTWIYLASRRCHSSLAGVAQSVS